MKTKRSKLISTRLEEEDAKALDEIARDENIDRATLVRKWILAKIKEHKLSKAAEYYRKGVVSIEEGAKMAQVSMWKFIEFVRENNIWPSPQKEEEIEKEWNRTKKLFAE